MFEGTFLNRVYFHLPPPQGSPNSSLAILRSCGGCPPPGRCIQEFPDTLAVLRGMPIPGICSQEFSGNIAVLRSCGKSPHPLRQSVLIESALSTIGDTISPIGY